MGLSVVINTSALAADAATNLSSGNVPHAQRAWLLRNVILPRYIESGIFSEIMVVGEFEPGLGYGYVPFDSVYHNCADALLKRQAGYEWLKNRNVGWVLFQHDDHMYDVGLNTYPAIEAADVLSPSRWTRARGVTGEALNDGTTTHINGHACLYRFNVAKEVPWTSAPPVFTWDCEITQRLLAAGKLIRYAPSLKVWDMEFGAQPWR